MIFDGDCGFCRFWIERWRGQTGDAVEYIAGQEPSVAARFPEITREALESSVHLVETDGSVFSGSQAVCRSLDSTRAGRIMVQAYEQWPGVAPASEFAYRIVARNRQFFSFLTRLFWGRTPGRPRFEVSTRWFLRCLGLVYLLAFWSLSTQLPGLIGARGLEPAADFMAAARRALGGGWPGVHWAPTLCWWSASDRFLQFQCAAGVALSLAALAGVAPGLSFSLLWVLYLSMLTIGQTFLGFQWDILLVEAGFLAIWLAPWKLWTGWKSPSSPSPLARWLYWWLMFRFMFRSGCVKLISGDPSWKDLTALNYHYQTQPLPTPLAWWAHHSPEWILKSSTAAMFFIELVLPFAILLPRRARHAAGLGFVALQIVILLTGNYTYFNLLAIALSLLLFDDAFFRQPAPANPQASELWSSPRRLTLIPVAAVIGLITLDETAGLAKGRGHGFEWARPIVTWFSPFHIANSYGLFAVMTKERDEIIIQGSADGQEWKDYQFRYKPGDLKRPPPWVAPHQPRLDWQMWFAALGSYQQNPWFVALMKRLLEGAPEVLALLEKNPFPDKPPQYVRALLYEYRFTTAAERAAGQGWWRREFKGAYFPEVNLGKFSRE
jgi:predicted DCC family thiol-disulfide oxidoreductase YuxK